MADMSYPAAVTAWAKIYGVTESDAKAMIVAVKTPEQSFGELIEQHTAGFKAKAAQPKTAVFATPPNPTAKKADSGMSYTVSPDGNTVVITLRRQQAKVSASGKTNLLGNIFIRLSDDSRISGNWMENR